MDREPVWPLRMWALCGYLLVTALPAWVRIFMSFLPDTVVLMVTVRILPWVLGAVLVSLGVPFILRRRWACLLLGGLGGLPFGVFLAFTGY